ncbi:MAG: CPBP family intramembrane metalloprotease, partial [Gemmataceae bacterium]|nr:CPBP family intramembrane metalloprotease [Gemmataceae bacterium]
LPPVVRDAVRKNVEFWRQAPWMVLLAMAVIPGVVEELFFRGFLFNALLRHVRPGAVIVVTAILFGLFHIFPGGFLAIERLLPSTLMGLILGWVRWPSGSVLPGALLHLAHNGLLLSAALFPQTFGPGLSEGNSGLPTEAMAASAAIASLGALLVWLGRRPSDQSELTPPSP